MQKEKSMEYKVTSLNPYENKNMRWLYCPDCGKKLAVYDKEKNNPCNTYPYCNKCRRYQKPTIVQQRRVPPSHD